MSNTNSKLKNINHIGGLGFHWLEVVVGEEGDIETLNNELAAKRDKEREKTVHNEEDGGEKVYSNIEVSNSLEELHVRTS